MKKIINNPLQVVDEMMGGILKAHPGSFEICRWRFTSSCPYKKSIERKVAIATGGVQVIFL